VDYFTGFFANIKKNIRKNIWSLHFYYLKALIVITFLLSLERYLPIFLLKICRIWHCALRVKNTINSQILLKQKFFFELNITIKPIGKKKITKSSVFLLTLKKPQSRIQQVIITNCFYEIKTKTKNKNKNQC
jgi:hypothetical protein